ncbi:MAG: hypothetical protein KDA65_16050 [Planctomycetaceae bacterium]|nr:hypothetical protein [Planctomycetaceae bacterium]
MSDEFVQRFLGAENTKEALAWLKAGPDNIHTLAEGLPTENSIELIQGFYDAGAKEVLAVEIDEYDDFQNTGKLVIELSDDPAERAAVLEKADEIAISQGFNPEQDSGQRYVFLMLD